MLSSNFDSRFGKGYQNAYFLYSIQCLLLTISRHRYPINRQ